MTGMKNRFVLTYVLLVIAQMLLCNYFHFTPYIMLTILPIMVFCIPTRVSVFWTLIIAFVTGLAVDYFAEGIIGLNAAALLPVAILRRTLIEAIFGPEPFEQEENITVKKYGLAKVRGHEAFHFHPRKGLPFPPGQLYPVPAGNQPPEL